jgi:hypothetical protein
VRGLLQQTLCRLGQLVEDRLGLLLADRVRVVRLDIADLLQRPSGRRVQQRARLGQGRRQPGGEPPGGGLGEPDRQRVAGFPQRLGQLRVEYGPRPPDGAVDHLGGQFRLGGRGDPVGQLVGLVDDQQLVRRHDVPAGEHVDREQAVVGDHHVGFPGPGAGSLGEAFGAVRTACRTDTLPGRHRHQSPGLVVDAWIELVPVAGLGLHRPVPQPLHLFAQPARLPEPPGAACARRGVEEGLRLVLGGVLQPGQAQVMVPPLEHGEGRSSAEQRLHGVGQPGQVVLDQLRLKGEGRGGDHHRPLHGQRGRQVGQGLAGAGAGLHQQVLTGADRLGDRPRHPLLAGTGRAAGHRAHDGGEEHVDVGCVPRLPETRFRQREPPGWGGRGVDRRIGGGHGGHLVTVPVDPDSVPPTRTETSAASGRIGTDGTAGVNTVGRIVGGIG